MDWCVNFPRESYIVYRPSLRKACGDNRNAAKFLSYLLFRASIRQEASAEAKHLNKVRKQQGLKPDQDDSIVILRTQQQVIQEMDHEISDRTLRDEAIPCLVELGYLTAEPTRTKEQYTAYAVNPVKIQEGIDHPEKVPHFKTMRFYQEILTRKQESLVRKNGGSEKTPNGKISEPERKNFRAGTEKFPSRELERFGKNSEPKNASEPASEAPSEGDFSNPRLLESNIRLNEREASHSLLHSSLSSQQGDLLSLEEQRIHVYWQELGFEADITPKLKEHWGKLVKHTQTFEQFKSLYEHTRQQIENDPKVKNKRVSPGNLTNANNLTGWKQTQMLQEQPSEPKEDKKSVLGVSGLPLCMSNPNEPRLPYKFNPGKSRRRVVAQ